MEKQNTQKQHKITHEAGQSQVEESRIECTKNYWILASKYRKQQTK